MISSTITCSISGDCGSHGTPRITTTTSSSLSPAALTYTPDTKPDISKQIVVAKQQDVKPSAKLTTYGEHKKKGDDVKKHVTFSDSVKVKCVNPKCGRTSILGKFTPTTTSSSGQEKNH